jgi:tetratricopeptide (TPR) repeat protein
VEHYGAGEAYLPLLEALSRVCRGADGPELFSQLRRFAPSWAIQLAGLLPAAEQDTLPRQAQDVTHERLLRELAEGIEALSRARPLLLLFEDLHWSDYSTVEALSVLARRHEPARLLIMGTYRPVELILREHPLKAVRQELQVHGQCQTLTLGYLNAAAIETYVDYRFSGQGPKADIAAFLHRRTEGHPLFMVNVADYLLQQGIAADTARPERKRRLAAIETEVPTGLQEFIEARVERLDAKERQVLTVASVAGMEFSGASVAAGFDSAIKAAEDICEELARGGQFIEEQGLAEWPDGTVSGRYRFRHPLYQEIVYARIAPARRVRLHRQMGERLEAGYGNRAREIASALAVHFERGRDLHKAVQYLQQAGKNDVQRSAYHDAVQQFTKGLDLLATLPDTPERLRCALELHMDLGGALTVTKGPVASEVEAVYRRALGLGQQLGEGQQLFGALVGLRSIHCIRAELPQARELADQLVNLAQRLSVPALLVIAHYALGETLFHLGELTGARQHLEQALTCDDSRHSQPHTLHIGVFSLGGAAWVQQLLGYADQARQRMQTALSLAQELSHPFNQIYILLLSAYIHQSLQDRQLTLERAETAMALCREHGISHWLMYGLMLQGWALAERGQIEQIRQGTQACQETGAKIGLSHQLAMLADACLRVQQPEEGLKAIAEAFTHLQQTGERHQEAELWRLKGELTRQQSRQVEASQNKSRRVRRPQCAVPNPHHLTPSTQEAETCFQQALAVARRQQAKTLELRAAISLARLWQQQGKGKDAHVLLAEIYGWFTEGFDTQDLQEAKALLETLR